MEQLVKMVEAHLGDREKDVRAAAAPPVIKVLRPRRGGGKPGRVCLQYTFRFGVQRFTLQDDFTVKGGAIRRLKRSRA